MEVHTRLDNIERLSLPDKIGRFLALADQHTAARELIILQDEGGLLNNDGECHAEFSSLIAALKSPATKSRVAIIARRKPGVAEPENEIPAIRVPPLDAEDMKRLLLRKLRDFQVVITESEATELADYMGGYPPAAGYVADFVRRNGVGQIVADKSSLVDFTASFMLRMLSKYQPLTDPQRAILVVLAYYSPLPLNILGTVVGRDAIELNQDVQYLLDVSFVVPDGRLFRISDPLINAVIGTFGRQWNGHSAVADALEHFLKSADDDTRFLLARALFRSLRYSGGTRSSAQSLALTADFINLSEYYYHERDYEKAVQFCKEALERRPGNVDVRSYLVRALIQKEEFNSAQEEIGKLVQSGHLRDAWFLRGFLHRHKQEFEDAIGAYKRSIEYGRKGAAVHRELAQCFYQIGDLGTAKYHITESQKSDPDNRYVVDLEIQIAMRLRDRRVAEQRLDVLRIVDSWGFYLHRRSTVNSIFGEREKAYADSLQSFAQFERPPFAIVSQLIKTEIETSRLDEAQSHLEYMDRQFGGRHDIRTGLRCKYETARGRYDEALGLWNRLRNRQLPVHLVLKYRALMGLKKVRPGEEVERELAELLPKLAGLDLDRLDQDFAVITSS